MESSLLELIKECRNAGKLEIINELYLLLNYDNFFTNLEDLRDYLHDKRKELKEINNDTNKK